MQIKLIVVVVGLKKWKWSFRLERSLRENRTTMLPKISHWNEWSQGTRHGGSTCQSTLKSGRINVYPPCLKSTKSLFEPIVCGVSVLNHLIRSK